MNEEQVKSALRWFVSTFGGMIAGWFAAKGWFTVDQVLTVLNSPTILAFVASLAAGGWSMYTHTKTNMVATVNAMPEVAGVITTAAPEGVKLANALPDAPNVAPAGTAQAANVARA